MVRFFACVVSLTILSASFDSEWRLQLDSCSLQSLASVNNQDDEVKEKTRKLAQHYRNSEWKEALEVLRLLKPDELDQYWFQLANLLMMNERCDRPKLGEMITASPKLAEWIANRFSGIFVGKRLYWSSSPLKNCINSCSVDTKSNYQIYVEPDLDSQKQLSLLVHELFCAENASETFELFAAGGGGIMEKDEFLVRLLKLDHRAALKQRAFYIIEHVPLELQLPGNLTDWSLSTPDDFGLFFESNLKSDVVKRYSEKFDLLRK